MGGTLGSTAVRMTQNANGTAGNHRPNFFRRNAPKKKDHC